jgi:hypothetical protein
MLVAIRWKYSLLRTLPCLERAAPLCRDSCVLVVDYNPNRVYLQLSCNLIHEQYIYTGCDP